MATKKKTTKGETEAPVTPVVFRKAQILTFQRYAQRRDLLDALLDENVRYTHEQVESLLDDFMKKE